MFGLLVLENYSFKDLGPQDEKYYADMRRKASSTVRGIPSMSLSCRRDGGHTSTIRICTSRDLFMVRVPARD